MTAVCLPSAARTLGTCQIRRISGDPPRVARASEHLLRRFVACRDAGDAAGAQEAWNALVEDNFDRVRALVDLRARRYGLSPSEREEAVQLALVKLWRNMVRSFRGSSMGEWVNATRRLVEFACAQVQRQAARRTAHQTGVALAAPGEEDDAEDRRLDELARRRHDREDERREAADFVAWALPRIANERRRTVLERTLDGVPAAAIAADLGVSMDNLYQLRRRALSDLAKLKELYDA